MDQIRRRLERDLVPWFETAERLTRWRAYKVYSIYFWLGEVFVLLVGLGFSHPAFKILAPQAGASGGVARNGPIIGSLGEGVMFYLAIFGLLVWGLLKIYVTKNDLERRCSLVKSGLRQFREQRIELENALRETDPGPSLTKIQLNLTEIVKRLHGEDSWPFPRMFAQNIDEAVTTEVDRLVHTFSDCWTSVPQPTQSIQQSQRVS